MGKNDYIEPAIRGRMYGALVDYSTERVFEENSEPDIKVKCNTFIIKRNDINDLQIAFDPTMFNSAIHIDIHQDDNVVVFRGNIEGIWIAHSANSGKELEYLYGNDISLEHYHKHMHTYTEVEFIVTGSINAAASFEGEWLDLKDEGVAYAILTAFATQNLTLAIEQTMDRAAVHRGDSTTYVASATSGNMLKVQVMMRYIRFKITNDGGIAVTPKVMRRYSQA